MDAGLERCARLRRKASLGRLVAAVLTIALVGGCVDISSLGEGGSSGGGGSSGTAVSGTGGSSYSGGNSSETSAGQTDYLARDYAAAYLAPGGGSGPGSEFELITWTMPDAVRPGDQVTGEIVWKTVRGNRNAVIYATLVGDWAPSSARATLVNHGMQGTAGTRFARTFQFTAPNAPGNYRVRWILVQAFAPLNNFYGRASGDAYSPPGGTWSELEFTVSSSASVSSGSSGGGSAGSGSSGGTFAGGSSSESQSNFKPGTYQGLVTQESDIFSDGDLVDRDERSGIQSNTINSQGLVGFEVGDRILRGDLTTEITSISVSASGNVIRLFYDAWGDLDGVTVAGSGTEIYTWLPSTDSIMFSGSLSVRTTNQSPELRQDSTLHATLVR